MSETMQPRHADTVVVGGGISGLTVAADLVRGGQDVELLEASSHLGGAIQTSVEDGFLIDHGADMFAVQPPDCLQLCEDLGFAGDLVVPQTLRRGAMIWTRGKMHPIPTGFVLMRATQFWPMLRTPLLGPIEKMRFFAERFVRSTKSRETDAEISVGEFVRRRMGRGVLDSIVAPLVGGIYTADIERLSMSAAMGQILAMQQRHGSLTVATRERRRQGLDKVEQQSAGARYGNFRSFPEGMVGLIDRVASAIPKPNIHLAAPVQRIDPVDGGRWRISFDQQGRACEITADRVVLSLPPPATRDVVKSLDASLADRIDQIESASAAIVYLGVRSQDIGRPIDAFGFVVPPRERSPLIAGSFASHKFDGRAPQDHVLIRCFMGGMLMPEILQKPDEALIDIALEELSRMIGLGGTPRVSGVIRWNQAMPQYNVGHQERIDAIAAGFAKHDGLHWRSNADGGVGISPSVMQARRLAREILNAPRKAGR